MKTEPCVKKESLGLSVSDLLCPNWLTKAEMEHPGFMLRMTDPDQNSDRIRRSYIWLD